MTREQRRILVIAYHFPPSAAVGGSRMATFARTLAAIGWEPHVLTIRDQDVAQLDRGRLRGLEGVAIHKARVLPTVEGIYATLRSRGRRAPSEPAAAPAPGPVARVGASRTGTLSRRVKRYLLSFLVLPDRERGWVLPAILAGRRLIQQQRVNWIVTSCPPYSAHLIGLALGYLTRARWVADFRDPWMTTGSKRLYPTCAASRAIESRLERMVIERADLVVFNVDRLRDAYRRRYRYLAPAKFAFIPNAVVSRPPAMAGSSSKYDVFTISYTGSLYLGRSPEPVCRAIAGLIQDGKVRPEEIRVKLVGHCREVDGIPTATLAHRYGLKSVVEIHDPVPHAEALEIISRSHIALLLAPDLQYQIPAKVYDYLGVRTPILAVAGDGGTADLIRGTGAGQVFSGDDVDGMMRFICQQMEAMRSGNGRLASPTSMQPYDPRRLTEELVGHLHRVEEAR